MRKFFAVFAPAMFLASCLTTPVPPPVGSLAPQVADGLTLWLTEAVPQIGSFVRITPTVNGDRATIVSNELAGQLNPVAGSTRDFTMSLTGVDSANLAINFFKKFEPSISGGKTQNISLTTVGTSTWTIPPENDVKPALLSLDRPEARDQRLRAMISAQTTVGKGPIYVVTGIYIAETATMKRNATGNLSAGLNCDLPGVICKTLNFKHERVIDGSMIAKGAPIFVRLKWVGERPSGLFGWAEESEGPKVVIGS